MLETLVLMLVLTVIYLLIKLQKNSSSIDSNTAFIKDLLERWAELAKDGAMQLSELDRQAAELKEITVKLYEISGKHNKLVKIIQKDLKPTNKLIIKTIKDWECNNEMTVNEFFKLALEIPKSKGFLAGNVNIHRDMLLIISEVTESMDELRAGQPPNKVYYSKGNKPEGVIVELLDVMLRTAHLIGSIIENHGTIDYEVDVNGSKILKPEPPNIVSLINEKFEYNKTRPQKHGMAF
jgi:hypothetical protein